MRVLTDTVAMHRALLKPTNLFDRLTDTFRNEQQLLGLGHAGAIAPGRLADLVRDLRRMAATAVLAERAPPLSKAAAKRAAEAFERAGSGGKTEERLEILHFLGWRQ